MRFCRLSRRCILTTPCGRLFIPFCLCVALSLAQVITARAQFSYSVKTGTATITGYSGPGGVVVIPDTIGGYEVTDIAVPAKGVFSASPITSLSIPNTVTNIGPATFANSSFLTSIAIPDSVVSIGSLAFSGCANLGSVWLGSNVMTLYSEVFINCSNLVEIAASTSSPFYTGNEGILFNKNGTTLVAFPPGKSGHYSLPGGVTEIANHAFATCRSLRSITTADGITTVGNNAFAYCSSLTNLTLSEGLTSIGTEAFIGCAGLVDLSIPGNVTNIGSRGFQGCSSLGSLTLPDRLGSLASYLFIGCTGLTNLDFGAGLTNISYAAFEYCSGLTRMTLPRGMKHIGFGALSDSGVVSLIVPDTVTSVGDFAFEWASSLRWILFEGNAPTTAGNTFYGSSPTIYYTAGTIGWSSAFAGRPALLWNPHILTGTSSVGVGPVGFGFNIVGDADLPIGVEASANLVEPAWSLLYSGTLTNGLVYFSDPNWIDQASHFYRITLP